MFKIIILLFVVITGKSIAFHGEKPDHLPIGPGWVVLSGKTHIEDPYANFRDAFAGSSHSSNDVRPNPLPLTSLLLC